MSKNWLEDFLYGRLTDAYKYFGAHLKKNENGEEGVEFVVYAPQAKRINVIGTFNSWSILGSEMKKSITEDYLNFLLKVLSNTITISITY